MKSLKLLILFSLTVILFSCSDNDDKKNKTTGDHVWKQQTDTLKTSKDAAKKLQETLNQQEKKLNENE